MQKIETTEYKYDWLIIIIWFFLVSIGLWYQYDYATSRLLNMLDFQKQLFFTLSSMFVLFIVCFWDQGKIKIRGIPVLGLLLFQISIIVIFYGVFEGAYSFKSIFLRNK